MKLGDLFGNVSLQINKPHIAMSTFRITKKGKKYTFPSKIKGDTDKKLYTFPYK